MAVHINLDAAREYNPDLLAQMAENYFRRVYTEEARILGRVVYKGWGLVVGETQAALCVNIYHEEDGMKHDYIEL